MGAERPSVAQVVPRNDVARLLLHVLRRPQRPAHAGHALRRRGLVPDCVGSLHRPWANPGRRRQHGPRRAPARVRRCGRLQQHRPGAVRGRRRLRLPVHVDRPSLRSAHHRLVPVRAGHLGVGDGGYAHAGGIRPKASVRCDSRQLGAGTRPRRHGGEPLDGEARLDLLPVLLGRRLPGELRHGLRDGVVSDRRYRPLRLRKVSPQPDPARDGRGPQPRRRIRDRRARRRELDRLPRSSRRLHTAADAANRPAVLVGVVDRHAGTDDRPADRPI